MWVVTSDWYSAVIARWSVVLGNYLVVTRQWPNGKMVTGNCSVIVGQVVIRQWTKVSGRWSVAIGPCFGSRSLVVW